MSNLHYLFHTQYYENIKLDIVREGDKKTVAFTAECKDKNDLLKEALFLTHSLISSQASHTFLAKTIYPGLLLGLGYPHDPGGVPDAIQLGFSFDYVTGMPYIPGSTVKGVLRSAFRNYADVIRDIASGSIKDVDLCKLEEGIFGEWVKGSSEAPFLKSRDIFFDAVIVRGNDSGRIFAEEYITPHKNTNGKPELDIFAEPNPIKLLKVLPGVYFEFRFLLRDSVMDEALVKAQDKLDLFKDLIALLGVGAKTNVGFGVMEIADAIPPAEALNAKPQEQGICKDCGKPVGKNKNGKYYSRCYDCNNKFNQARAKELKEGHLYGRTNR